MNKNNDLKNPEELLKQLKFWLEIGWIKSIDYVLAEFMYQQCKTKEKIILSSAVIFSITLVSHQLGRGHVCLDLLNVLTNAKFLLSLPPISDKKLIELRQIYNNIYIYTPEEIIEQLELNNIEKWISELKENGKDIIMIEGQENIVKPFVLKNNNLYLYRYYNNEKIIEENILQRIETNNNNFNNLQNEQQKKEFKNLLDLLFPQTKNNKNKIEIDYQKIAAVIACNRNFSIITGGPGTGKTSTVLKIILLRQKLYKQIKNDENAKLNIQLAAPTGKAAARLENAIKININEIKEIFKNFSNTYFNFEEIPQQVHTLHKLLGAGNFQNDDNYNYKYNKNNPLAVDLLIVDEASMISVDLMAALMSALTKSTILILLGDKDQLTSVEAGSLLSELCFYVKDDLQHYEEKTINELQKFFPRENIKNFWKPSKIIVNNSIKLLNQSIVKLQRSYRFDEKSGIGQLAKAVNENKFNEVEKIFKQDDNKNTLRKICFTQSNKTDFDNLIIEGYRIYLEEVQYLKENFPKSLEELNKQAKNILILYQQFQILCVIRHSEFGVNAINKYILNLLKKEKLIEEYKGNRFSNLFYGQPILITKNDAELQLRNGDIGIVLPYFNDNLRIAFLANTSVDENNINNIIWIAPNLLKNYENVFALTVHKSQGSEFDSVVLVLPNQRNPILSRELLYTGITRAKKKFTLIETNNNDNSNKELLKQAINHKIYRCGGLFLNTIKE